jgi:hypothetical protein
MLTGGSGWNTLPVAIADGAGTFRFFNNPVGAFGADAATSGVQVVPGDFNGDGLTDVALVGGLGWNTIPLATTNRTTAGTFTVTNGPAGTFDALADTAGARLVTGDFNGDGRTDIALVGGQGWNTIPVALSKGNGTFNVINAPAGNFDALADAPGAQVVTGRFNGDGRTDVALVGGQGWNTIPVATLGVNGTWTATNDPVGTFDAWADTPGAKVVIGDFNGDGRTDVALVGGHGWTTIPVATSAGNGAFQVTNRRVGSSFDAWADIAGARVVTGNFGSGRTDIALVGGQGWTTIPLATSQGGGAFTITDKRAPFFNAWVDSPGAKLATGTFDGTLTSLALVGGNGWNSIPMATPTGNGDFIVTNTPGGGIPFDGWANTPGVTAISGTGL